MRGLALALLCACGPTSAPGTAASDFDWGLPDGVDPPPVPADNPMSVEKVALGRALFYDFRLSLDEARSCGLCHEQAKGFTDGFPRAVGALGDLHHHNAQPIVNVGYRQALTWNNPDLRTLEEQVLLPLFGDEPVEMGRTADELEALLVDDPALNAGFEQAFPDDPEPWTVPNLARALAAFERTLISVDSPWDRWLRGEGSLSASELRGLDLFESDRLGCTACHSGLDLADPPDGSEPVYANLGLYDLDGQGSYPEGGEGLLRTTGDPADMGRFRTPTLRNLAWTAPYFHDGTGATLEDVVDVLAAGGRVTGSGPNIGDGRANPHKDPRITGFALSPEERSDLVAFLLTLSDPGFVEDPRFADPVADDR